jgi:hypothetical protein
MALHPQQTSFQQIFPAQQLFSAKHIFTPQEASSNDFMCTNL